MPLRRLKAELQTETTRTPDLCETVRLPHRGIGLPQGEVSGSEFGIGKKGLSEVIRSYLRYFKK